MSCGEANFKDPSEEEEEFYLSTRPVKLTESNLKLSGD